MTHLASIESPRVPRLRKTIFTRDDTGCWIDGACGYWAAQSCLADIVRSAGFPALATELLAATDLDESADLAAEALAALQRITAPDLVWLWESGDLFLARESDLA